jgi:hypothetical protein
MMKKLNPSEFIRELTLAQEPIEEINPAYDEVSSTNYVMRPVRLAKRLQSSAQVHSNSCI